MKRKTLLSVALLSAIVLSGVTPLTSHAAEADAVRGLSGKCFKVYIKYFCPGQEIPGLETPAPEAPTPEVPAPEAPMPEAPAPEAPMPPVEEDQNTQAPDIQEPDTDRPEEATPSYAEQVVKLVNAERAKVGLAALELDTDITAAANIRANEIKLKFSHTRPNGSSFSSVLREQGVIFRGSGENIAWGQKSPEQVMNAWMNSDGHRANILNPNFKKIGVGHYQDEKGVNYWAQLFTY